MSRRKLKSYLALLLVAVLCGCSPRLSHTTSTSIDRNEICERNVTIAGTPHEKFPDFKVRLENYLNLPDSESFDAAKVSAAKAVYSGTFRRASEAPVDFSKVTRFSDKVSRNSVSCKKVNAGVFEFFVYEEKVSDIITHKQGKKALAKVVDMVLEVLLETTRQAYASEYDLTQLEKYVRQTFPPLAQRLYDKLWEVRTSNITKSKEEVFWRKVLSKESAALGLAVSSEQMPGGKVFAKQLFKNFADMKLSSLAIPRKKSTPAFNIKLLKGDAMHKTLLEVVASKYGDMTKFLHLLQMKLPEIFGAFLVAEVEILPLNPSFTFNATVHLPGKVFRTNGVKSKGDIKWKFTGRDVALSGYTMRAISFRELASLRKLKLNPLGNEAKITHKFLSLLINADGTLDAGLCQTLRACANANSLVPMKENKSKRAQALFEHMRKLKRGEL